MVYCCFETIIFYPDKVKKCRVKFAYFYATLFVN